MKYIFIQKPALSGSIGTPPEDETKFRQNYDVVIGIEGDAHGLTKGDSAAIDWPKSEAGDHAEAVTVPAALQVWLDAKYNML